MRRNVPKNRCALLAPLADASNALTLLAPSDTAFAELQAIEHAAGAALPPDAPTRRRIASQIGEWGVPPRRRALARAFFSMSRSMPTANPEGPVPIRRHLKTRLTETVLTPPSDSI